MVVFTDFLRKHNMYNNYMHNIKTNVLPMYTIDKNTPCTFIINAFCWDNAEWADLHSNWCNLCSNLPPDTKIVFDRKAIEW